MATLRDADVALLVAAAAAQTWRYLLSGALLRILTELRYTLSLQISTAAVAIGALLPGAQPPGRGHRLPRAPAPRHPAPARAGRLDRAHPGRPGGVDGAPRRAGAPHLGHRRRRSRPAGALVLDVLARRRLLPRRRDPARRRRRAPGTPRPRVARARRPARGSPTPPASGSPPRRSTSTSIPPRSRSPTSPRPRSSRSRPSRGGVGLVEAAVPFILAAGVSTSYADAALAVLVWRVLSFWIPTLAGAGALASLHRPFHLRTAWGRTIVP